jgi:hypothetical protein
MIDPLRAKGAPAELAVGVTPSPRPHSASNACERVRIAGAEKRRNDYEF